ncbi:MAG: hypothetical protein WKH64_13880 [Chloroflexia bacterium]
MDKGFVSEKQAAAALERAVAEGRVTPEEAEAARRAAGSASGRRVRRAGSGRYGARCTFTGSCAPTSAWTLEHANEYRRARRPGCLASGEGRPEREACN